jgi:NAD(P)-dependent dehydrogenase (short-subunit alcohol dehydrogenase family)
MAGYWQDKVVVVTGGSQGFGRAIADAYAAAGAKIAIIALDDGQLDPAVDALKADGCDAIGLGADVTSQADVDRAFAKIAEHFGRIDVLVNCAGRSTRGAILDITPEDFQSLLNLNFMAMVRCTRAAAKPLIESGGHIVNIGSLAAKSAAKFVGAYPVSKHAVAAYSHQLRLELADQGVHVLLVCPGPLTRDDAGVRYKDEAGNLPDAARKPGGGVQLKGIRPDYLACRILKCCERRKPELVVPAKARLLFAISQLSPTLGDWIIRKMT